MVALNTLDGDQMGRLGNHLITFENMIYESIASNCLVHLPSRIKDLSFYTPTCNVFNATQKYAPFATPCLHNSSEELFRLSNTSTGVPMAEMRSSYGATVGNLRMKYLSTNVSHAYGMACPNEKIFSLHIRSGDITQGHYNRASGHFEPGHVHHSYAPYPTSYYAQVLRTALESRYDRIIIFCENLSSPGCSAFDTFTIAVPRIEMSAGASLQNDLRLLS